MPDRPDAVPPAWLAALETRHLKNLRVPELTRALRALSSAYVERRQRVPAALDTAGKRAAFALFYAPLHFMTVTRLVSALELTEPEPAGIVDLGCGTGAAGAAWALALGGRPFVRGLDRHRWAIGEARWTYRQLGLRGTARIANLQHLPALGPDTAVIAAYVLNEVADDRRRRLEDWLFACAAHGARVLVVEPIARAIAPWWDPLAVRAVAFGGRADQWRFEADLPELLHKFDTASGLNHRHLACRTILFGSGRAGPWTPIRRRRRLQLP